VSDLASSRFSVGVHLLTLLSLAPEDTATSSEEMAGSVGSNPVHVRRVLGRLRSAGLVTSRPGVHGGWMLTRSPNAVTLGDVWRAVRAEDGQLLGLHAANPDCEVGREIQGVLGDIDRDAARALEAELDATTIGDVTKRATDGRARVARPWPSRAAR
jgi:Rrf2 family protein